MKLKIMLGSIFLLIFSFVFNSSFEYKSLDKLYLNSVISKYRLIGEDLKRKIEIGLLYGNIDKNLIDIKSLLVKAEQHIHTTIVNKKTQASNDTAIPPQSNISASIALPNRRIIISTDESKENTFVPENFARKNNKPQDRNNSLNQNTFFKYKQDYYVILPVQDSNDAWISTIVISIESNLITANLSGILKNSIVQLLSLLIGASFLLIIFLESTIHLNHDTSNFSKRKISLGIILIICTTQIIFSALNFNKFRSHYYQSTKENAEIITTLLKDDAYFLLNNAYPNKELYKFETWLKGNLDAFQELNNVTILDKKKHPIYTLSRNFDHNIQEMFSQKIKSFFHTILLLNPEFNISIDVINDDIIQGYVDADISQDVYSNKLLNIALDSLTFSIISILFLVELLILLFKVMEGPLGERKRSLKIHYSAMRPAAFLFLFGIDISISFIPLHMENLYSPILGLSKDTVLGLPISIEFLFVGLSIFLAGIWNDRRGWYEPFLVGLFLAATGGLYSWAATNMYHFIVARAVVGVGYGLLLLAAQGFVIAYSDFQSKAQALAQFIAGLYAGSICGGATGALLADRLGYRPVFLIGAIILYCVIGYTMLFLRQVKPVPEISSFIPSSKVVSTGYFSQFIRNKVVLSLIFLSSLPASIAVVGFLHYFCPLYLNSIGASQANIGRIFMIYGISLIYIGPFISRHVDTSLNKKYYIFAGCLLCSMTFLIFYFFSGFLAATIAVFLMGLSSCLVIASQSAYLLNLKVTQKFGEGKAIGIFRSSSRIGQALGPLIFSVIIIGNNIKQGITHLGLLYLLTAFLFLLLTQRDHLQFERYKK